MSQMQGPNAPGWLCQAIIEGVQGLVALKLRGAPKADTLQTVANLWIVAVTSRPIAWDEALDKPRIRQAFLDLSATAEYWPAPAQFLNALRPRADFQAPQINPPRSNGIPPDIRKWLNDFSSRGKRIAEGN